MGGRLCALLPRPTFPPNTFAICIMLGCVLFLLQSFRNICYMYIVGLFFVSFAEF